MIPGPVVLTRAVPLGLALLAAGHALPVRAEAPAPESPGFDLGVAVKPRFGAALSLGGARPRLTLTPYGQLNLANLSWDDGLESGNAIVDQNSSSSRLGVEGALAFDGLLGPALGDGPWSIGGQFELGLDYAGSTTTRATDRDRTRVFIPGDNRAYVRIAQGWLDTPYGRLTLGQGYPVIANWTPNPGRTFAVDQASWFLTGGGFNPVIETPRDTRARLVRPWSAYAAPMQWSLATPIVQLRYDSPEVAGFRFSLAKGRAEILDLGLRWRGDVGRLNVHGSLAWHRNRSNNHDSARIGFPEFEEALVGGLGARDRPTGLFAVAGINHRMFDGSHPNDFTVDGARRPDDWGLWSQVGLRRDLTGLGDTVVYGVMGHGHDRGVGRSVPQASGAQWLETRVWMAGAMLLQELDFARAAGMRLELYAGYRQWRGRFRRTTSGTDRTAVNEGVEPLSIVTTGLRWRF